MPAGFQQRLGRSTADFHFSGAYMFEGKRIGYLRVPSFSPASSANAQRELAGEIAFFRQNTDGLVVDVQRNPGGGCYMLTLASYLIPQRFWFFGQEMRPNSDIISSYQATLELARELRVEQWLIDTIEFQLGMIKEAYAENRGMTGPIPACSFMFENEPLTDTAGRPIAYEKPLIILTDEFSTSAGDIFPAMMQDNQRGLLVGTRTNGAGGSVSVWDAGFFMEGAATNTNTLVTRREPRAVQDYPTSSYIENVGVHPDVPLERMTRENLLSGGRQFTDGFSRIIVEEINKAAR
jgi:C-terminal processing protease CtpA/Prc